MLLYCVDPRLILLMSHLIVPVISYLGSTRHSIQICWKLDKSVHAGDLSYTVQIADKTYEWIVKYWGLKTEATIKDLAPEEIYNIRVGVSRKLEDANWSDEVWSEIFTSATKFDEPWSFYLFNDIDRGVVDNINQFIKERNSALGVVNKHEETALIKAIRLKRDNAVQLLIKGGAEVNQQTGPSLRTPLMVSCYYGNIFAALLLVAKGADMSLKDRSGLQALHYAVDNSQLEMVKFALDNGAFIDAKDEFGWTPLMRGIILEADISLISLLIEKGSDILSQDNWKRNALSFVKLFPENERLEKLFQQFKKEDVVKDVKDEVPIQEECWWSDDSKTSEESELDILEEHRELLKEIIGWEFERSSEKVTKEGQGSHEKDEDMGS